MTPSAGRLAAAALELWALLCLAVAACQGPPARANSLMRVLHQSGNPEALVAGGTRAQCGRFPYMSSLRDRENNHKCGAVLIDPQWVLTAAHCLDPRNRESIGLAPIVVVGACNVDDVENANGKVEFFQAKDTFMNSNWTGDVADGYDIALIRVNGMSEHTPVGLPPRELKPDGSKLVALGWGEMESGRLAKNLQQASSIQFVRQRECSAEDVWGDLIIDSMLCAFSNMEDVCRGDSGGPLLQPFRPGAALEDGAPNLDVVVGVVSFGDSESDCSTPTLPSVYTLVSAFRDWIEATIESPSSAVRPPMIPPPESSVAAEPAACCPAPPKTAVQNTPQVQEEVDEELWKAARNGDLDAVMEALRKGASASTRSGPSETTPLMEAATGGHLPVVEELLTANPDIDGSNAWGATALFLASQHGHADVVEGLTEVGADVDRATNTGVTPLNIASEGGHGGSVSVLLEAGADPNLARDDGHTPLHLASLTIGPSSQGIVEGLLDAGAELDARGVNGWTPLMWGAYYGNVGTLGILVDAGANRRVRGEGGLSAKGLICGCVNDEGLEGVLQCPRGGCELPETQQAIRDLLQ